MEGNKWLKDTLSMARKGFKWKSMCNQDGLRYQIMQMNRPKDNEVGERSEPLTLLSGNLYTQGEKTSTSQSKNLELPAVTAATLLSLKGEKKLEELNPGSKFSTDLDKLPEGFSIAGTRTTYGSTYEEVSTDLEA